MSTNELYEQAQKELEELGILDFPTKILTRDQVKEAAKKAQQYRKMNPAGSVIPKNVKIYSQDLIYLTFHVDGLHQIDFLMETMEQLADPENFLPSLKESEVLVYHNFKYRKIEKYYNHLKCIGVIHPKRLRKSELKAFVKKLPTVDNFFIFSMGGISMFTLLMFIALCTGA